ncbi:MAG: NAD+ synthase, partial [Chloroflexi bacterium]|nr:NAD+ synthase [Chloroflexota bacterium]
MRTLRLGLAQINPTVGDLVGNGEKIRQQIEEARRRGVEIVCFPELCLTGYPPEDLVLKPRFIADNLTELRTLAGQTRGITAIVGFVDANTDIYNAAAVLHNGMLAGVYHKQYLPNYGVFDEDRYFQAGRESPVIELEDVTVGINICEDIWYPVGPAVDQALAGAEVIVNINASPYHVGKRHARHRMLATRAADNAVIVAYVNMVGGQDELVFDGNSLVFDQQGNQVVEGRQFAEDLVVVDLDLEAVFRTRLHDPRRRKERRLAPDV